MKNKICFFTACVAFVVAVFWACSADNDVAGGVSEETNTIAGVVLNVSGNSVAGATVVAKSIYQDVAADTSVSDDAGMFKLTVTKRGTYGVSAVKENFASYDVVKVDGKDVSLKVSLMETGSYSGIVEIAEEESQNISVGLPGSSWIAQTDVDGSFKLDNLPVGTHLLLVKSPDQAHYDNGYYVANIQQKNSYAVGPLPMDFAVENADDLLKLAPSAKLTVPVSEEYGLRSWWNMDAVSETGTNKVAVDSRSWTDGILLYGSPDFVSRNDSKVLVLNGAEQFGVIEGDHQLFDDIETFTVEAWVRVDSVLDKSSAYRKNIIGKLGFGTDADEDVFSLALVQGDCGVGKASLGFFVADGASSSFECENAAVSKEPLVLGQWLYVVSTWSKGVTHLYINGKLVGEATTDFEKMNPSRESVFFGKEKMKVELDDVRISVSTIRDSDVRYRYYKNGGSL